MLRQFSSDYPNDLSATLVKILDKSVCNAEFIFSPLTENMFCAGDLKKDAAEGDSGGPAVYNDTLIGVISAGGSNYKALGTYTKVNNYYQWILNNIMYNKIVYYYY